MTATYQRLGPNQAVLLLYNMTFSWQREGSVRAKFTSPFSSYALGSI